MKQRGWIVCSGCVWLAIGFSLLYKGLDLMAQALFLPDSLSSQLQPIFGSIQQSSTALIAFGLIIGFLKGRFVLAKTVRRVVSRIASLPLPIRLSQVYTTSYWMLIGSMIALGMTFRFLPIPIDVRGVIDVAIGSALIHGAILYFQASRAIYGIGSPAQSP